MILDDIVKDKKIRLVQAKENVSLEEMKEKALKSTRQSISFYEALAKPGLSIIGEFKKASPSHGKMDNKISLESRIKDYSESADAISCLTEEDHFNGSVDYLMQIREMTKLPIIRKDFIIDPYQVYEAKVIGADAILLIAAILRDEELKSLYELATSLGLDCLCEVHDEKEMERMLGLGVKIIGINNRNLWDFTIDLNTTKKLSDMIPASLREEGVLLVSESGVSKSEDVVTLSKSKANALLIGTVLMEAESPKALIKDFKEAYESYRD
ncbi:MAG: indole-3-glycerol phosphate synthase TrpC [Lachnospira sp.]|jgi:indole-3-glycerol phosphate synthase|nr:indole-3-glycerol phosphate synthase TrpC [Lachnospira sp.]